MLQSAGSLGMFMLRACLVDALLLAPRRAKSQDAIHPAVAKPTQPSTNRNLTLERPRHSSGPDWDLAACA